MVGPSTFQTVQRRYEYHALSRRRYARVCCRRPYAKARNCCSSNASVFGERTINTTPAPAVSQRYCRNVTLDSRCRYDVNSLALPGSAKYESPILALANARQRTAARQARIIQDQHRAAISVSSNCCSRLIGRLPRQKRVNIRLRKTFQRQ